jgi:hypothetical protein
MNGQSLASKEELKNAETFLEDATDAANEDDFEVDAST